MEGVIKKKGKENSSALHYIQNIDKRCRLGGNREKQNLLKFGSKGDY